MLLAAAMTPTWQAIFFGIAVLLFLLAAFNASLANINLVALGLAFFAFVFFWLALP